MDSLDERWRKDSTFVLLWNVSPGLQSPPEYFKGTAKKLHGKFTLIQYSVVHETSHNPRPMKVAFSIVLEDQEHPRIRRTEQS